MLWPSFSPSEPFSTSQHNLNCKGSHLGHGKRRDGIKIEKNGTNGYEILLDETGGGRFAINLDGDGDFSIFLGSTDGRS